MELKGGKCPTCRKTEEQIEASKTSDQRAAERAECERAIQNSKTLFLTTEAFVENVDRLDVVATEVVLGMNIFKDIAANFRDVVGGRSSVVQRELEEARDIAFEELRLKASKMGADGVIAMSINYHTMQTGNSVNMLIVSVTGTAVKKAA